MNLIMKAVKMVGAFLFVFGIAAIESDPMIIPAVITVVGLGLIEISVRYEME